MRKTKEEKEMDTLMNWMKYSNYTNEEQIDYLKRLVVDYEYTNEYIKEKATCLAIAGYMSGIGLGTLLYSNLDLTTFSIIVISSGLVVALVPPFKKKKNYILDKYKKVEIKRQEIKEKSKVKNEIIK